jgi:acyl-CoA thioesterase YciA
MLRLVVLRPRARGSLSGRSTMDMVGKSREINISCESFRGDLMAQSRREPIIRTVPQPADMNSNGDIFGGWVLSQMDIAGGALAAKVAKGRVATVAITAMTFLQPIKVGDMVSIYGDVTRIGRTSITIHLQTMVQRRHDATEIQVTHGTFVFVAIDEQGKPRPLPQEAMA